MWRTKDLNSENNKHSWYLELNHKREINNKIIAIDFDNTIVEQKYPNIGNLKPSAKEIINKLYYEGFVIVIWTNRSNKRLDERQDLTEAVNFLNENKIKYDEVNRNSKIVKYGCYPKIYADIYIDDRNLFHIDDWNIIYDEIHRRTNK
jgi:hypothetical protein